MNTGRNSKRTTCLCRDTGGKGMLPAQRTSFNTLVNWGHKTPTQSKRKRNRKEKVKGTWPKTHTIHSITLRRWELLGLTGCWLVCVSRRVFRLTCQRDGTWSGEHCVKVTCPKFDPVFTSLLSCTDDVKVASRCTLVCPGSNVSLWLFDHIGHLMAELLIFQEEPWWP